MLNVLLRTPLPLSRSVSHANGEGVVFQSSALGGTFLFSWNDMRRIVTVLRSLPTGVHVSYKAARSTPYQEVPVGYK
jgi:hypothetical protein